MEAKGRVVRSNPTGKAIPTSNQEPRYESLSRAIGGQSWEKFPAIFHGFAEKAISEARTRPPEIDGLCMTQACRGVLIDLRCTIEAWAEQYGIPDEALRAMLADAFLFERAGMKPLSPEYFVELASNILAEQAESDAEGGVE